jgi:hypothetical protein
MPFPKLPNNQEDREVYLRDLDAANFIIAFTDARKNKIDTLIMTLDAFEHEPELLYVALDYAKHSGVTVTIAPPVRD